MLLYLNILSYIYMNVKSNVRSNSPVETGPIPNLITQSIRTGIRNTTELVSLNAYHKRSSALEPGRCWFHSGSRGVRTWRGRQTEALAPPPSQETSAAGNRTGICRSRSRWRHKKRFFFKETENEDKVSSLKTLTCAICIL